MRYSSTVESLKPSFNGEDTECTDMYDVPDDVQCVFSYVFIMISCFIHCPSEARERIYLFERFFVFQFALLLENGMKGKSVKFKAFH
jgi:hypothetical protein